MTKKTRLIILLSCGFLFLVVTPSIVLYSLGYRIDFEKKRIVATGGIYVKIWPQPAEVFIDSKLSGKTNMFFDYVFAQNLLPKQHNVLIKKEGYFPYQKTLTVKEKEVAKLEHIVLFRENMGFELLKNGGDSPFEKKDPDAARISPDNKKFLHCGNYEIFFSLADSGSPEKTFVNRFSEKIGDCLWLNDDYIAFIAGGKIKISEINNANEVNTIELTPKITLGGGEQIEIKNPEIFFDRQNKKLYILSENSLLSSEKIMP